MTSIQWLSERLVDGQLAVRIGREGAHVVAEWPDLARLVVGRHGETPELTAAPHATPESVEKLRAGAVRALVGYLRGELHIHASAVSWGEGAIAFLGDADAGKSTLAHSLCAHGSWSFLSDDILRLEGLEATPSETVSWLRGPARELFGAVDATLAVPRIAKKSSRLHGLIELIWSDGPVQLRALKGVAAASVILRSMVRVPLDEPALHLADLERTSNLVRHVPVFELVRPRGLGRLVDVHRLFDAARDRGFVWT